MLISVLFIKASLCSEQVSIQRLITAEDSENKCPIQCFPLIKRFLSSLLILRTYNKKIWKTVRGLPNIYFKNDTKTSQSL